MAEAVLEEECSNGLLILTLDRQKALNAVNVPMLVHLRAVLSRLKGADGGSVKAVLIQGAGERGFSAGGDVKSVSAELAKGPENPFDNATEQLYQEYLTLHEFRSLTIPTMSLVHGITMGCGLALGGLARYAVATEKSRLAMPENNIGLFPDAGFTYMAANIMPKGVGRLMALTGCHLLGGGDAVASQLARYFVPAEQLPALVEALKSADLAADPDAAVRACVEAAAQPAPPPKLLAEAPWQGKFAQASTAAEAFQVLEEAASEEGSEAGALLKAAKGGAPFSQALVFQLLAAAETDAASEATDLERLEMDLERHFAAACRAIVRPDFTEGVRAVLIDKDMQAKWQPAALADVSAAEIEATLAPLAAGERMLGLQK